SEPQEQLLLRLELAEKTHGITFALRICHRLAAPEIPQTPAPFPLHAAPVVNKQRRCDFVQIRLQRRICSCHVAELSVSELSVSKPEKIGAQKTQVTFLKNIVRESFVSRGAPEITPQPRCGLYIEDLKRGLVHASRRHRR